MTGRWDRPVAAAVALSEATLSVVGHPGRSALVSLGALIGAVLYTATLGLVGTARSEVRSDFDAFRATEVVASFEGSDSSWVESRDLDRVRRLSGVVSAGLVRTSSQHVSVSTVIDLRATVPVRVSGATPSALDVIEPHLVSGRLYDPIHEDRGVPVAIVPDTVLGELPGVRLGSQILVEGQPVVVIGTYDRVAREVGVLGALLVPLSVSESWLGATPPEVVVEVVPGAAKVVAGQLPVALRPGQPELVSATTLLDPEQFRIRIEDNVVQLSLASSIAALVVGTIVIGIAAGSSVATRTAEFGLRRALGATPADMGFQVLGETLLLGAIGGAVGASLGLVATVGVALVNGWTPALDLAAAFRSVGFSAAAGLVGGAVPSRRAMRIEPAEALRR